MASVITYNQIISVLKDISERHPSINSFGVGELSDFGSSSATTPVMLWARPVKGTFFKSNEGDSYPVKELQMELRAMDLVNKGIDNLQDVHSDTFQILSDVITEINEHPYYQNSFLGLTGDIELTPLEEWADEEMSGWYCTLNLRMKNNTQFCGLPFSSIPGFSFPGIESSAITYNTQFLTCATVTACTTFQDYIADAISTIPSADTNSYTTGATLIGTTAFFNRNDLLSAYTLDLSSLSGGSSASLWSASTGLNSIIANNGSGNLAQGNFNIVAGYGNIASASYSVVGGGKSNSGSGTYNGILGGKGNIVSGNYSSIVGGGAGAGYENRVSATWSIIGGGFSNLVSGPISSILGGGYNIANQNYTFIGGGRRNTAGGKYSAIAGGQLNATIGTNSFIGGGNSNSATSYSSVVGGKTNLVSGFYSAVVNGKNNVASGLRTVVIGGQNITGATNDTVYVPFLNIRNIHSGTTTINLGLDSSGNVVTGSTASQTSIQNGLNTYTGGTTVLPTVNISAATLNYLSATTLSATTALFGSRSPSTYPITISNNTNRGIAFTTPGGSFEDRFNIFLGNGSGGYVGEELYFLSVNSNFHFKPDGRETLALYTYNSSDANAQIIGQNSDSSKYALRVKNSTGGTILQMRNDLRTEFSGDTYLANNAGSKIYSGGTLLENIFPAVQDVLFTIPFVPGGLSPSDSTTYYFNIHGGTGVPTATATNWDASFPFNITVVGCVMSVGNNTTVGTAEAATLQIRNTSTSTSTPIGTFSCNGSTTNTVATTMSGVSISIPAGELFSGQIDTPVFATNPVAMVMRGYLICKRA